MEFGPESHGGVVAWLGSTVARRALETENLGHVRLRPSSPELQRDCLSRRKPECAHRLTRRRCSHSQSRYVYLSITVFSVRPLFSITHSLWRGKGASLICARPTRATFSPAFSEAAGVVSIARIERPQLYRGGSASTETMPAARSYSYFKMGVPYDFRNLAPFAHRGRVDRASLSA